MSKKRFGFDGLFIIDNGERKAFQEVVGLLNSLYDENEQLRNAIQSFLKEADMFSEKATDHDIVAYREMRKFDNKDAYYLACAIAELKKVIDDV